MWRLSGIFLHRANVNQCNCMDGKSELGNVKTSCKNCSEFKIFIILTDVLNKDQIQLRSQSKKQQPQQQKASSKSKK